MNVRPYHTHDPTLTAVLVASGATRLTDITANGDGRKLFCFAPRPPKKQLIQFYSGEAQVSARRFAEAFATRNGTGFTMREYA